MIVYYVATLIEYHPLGAGQQRSVMRNGHGKAVGIGAALLMGTGIVWLAVKSHTKDVETERQAQAARLVSVLPPGVEGAWLAYVDRQIARFIARREDTLELFGPTLIVSINTPFDISCDPMLGAKITFGYGEPAADVGIIGPIMRMPPFEELPWWLSQDQDTEPVPDLPVDVRSVAARKLVAELCERISERIQALVRR